MRNHAWHWVLGLFAVNLIATPVEVGAAHSPVRPPNVILILSDDQGTLDLNCYGSKDLQTPHLDALARRGVRFTQFYVASPVCSPSRAALLTGRQPMRAGIKGNVSSRAGQAGMPTEEITLAEMLKAVGYRTALFGKWHLGTIPECEPRSQGFDKVFGFKGGCIDSWSHFMYWEGPHFHDLWRDEKELWENGVYFSDLMVREAQRFLKENRARPFFLYLPFNVPHYPCQPPEKYLKLYQQLPEPRRSYAAAVTALDAAIGEVLAKVDQLGLRQNTLIIFLSDHGHSTEERAGFGGGNAGPFRGAKFSLFEGGIRVACIASWPGHIPEGEIRGQPVVSMDWLPTIAELCGIPIPNRKMDGRSLTPVLRSASAKSPHEVFYWQIGEQWAIREGDWKLIVNANATGAKAKLDVVEKVFLANLEKDLAETNNFAAAQPGIIERLTRLHQLWSAGLSEK